MSDNAWQFIDMGGMPATPEEEQDMPLPRDHRRNCERDRQIQTSNSPTEGDTRSEDDWASHQGSEDSSFCDRVEPTQSNAWGGAD